MYKIQLKHLGILDFRFHEYDMQQTDNDGLREHTSRATKMNTLIFSKQRVSENVHQREHCFIAKGDCTTSFLLSVQVLRLK